MGLFGAIGRETKGAVRSLAYDLRRSRRFRRIGVIAVATVAGGVLATGTLLREPVPGLSGLGGDGEDAGIIDGWFGFGSETAGQDAEAPESASESPAGGEGADPSVSPTEERTQSHRSGSGNTPNGTPGLVPVGGDETAGPREEEPEDGTGTPSPAPEPSQEPTEGPTSQPPTQEPSQEPTSASPTPEPSPSTTATGEGQATKTAVNAPDPQKGPVGS